MTEPAVRVAGLSVRYADAPARALDDVSFTVGAGEVFGVLGPTGSGKSTLLKCLAGVIPHYEQEAAHLGAVGVLGADITDRRSLADTAADIALVLQDPEVQVLNPVVREELAWGMENRGVPTGEIRRRLADAADLFGIGTLLDRFTHALSGGEKQRMIVAAMYCLRPKLILLDEPTSELDPAGSEDVLAAIRLLTREGVTVVVVEHKIEEMAQHCDRLLVLSDTGRAVAVGPTRQVLTDPAVPYRPQVVEVAQRLARRGAWPAPVPLTVDEAVEAWSAEPVAEGAVSGD